MDATKFNITTCDLVEVARGLAENYSLGIDCNPAVIPNFPDYYFCEKKKIPQTPKLTYP